jgi:hypothetical protein
VKLPRFITPLVSQFTITTLLTLHKVVDCFTQKDPLDELEEFYKADNGGQD